MSKTVRYIGLNVHEETIAVAIAPQNTTEVRHYSIICGTFEAIRDSAAANGSRSAAKNSS